eukprot:108347-Chlamydomonas_euryale.AAC.6
MCRRRGRTRRAAAAAVIRPLRRAAHGPAHAPAAVSAQGWHPKTDAATRPKLKSPPGAHLVDGHHLADLVEPVGLGAQHLDLQRGGGRGQRRSVTDLECNAPPRFLPCPARPSAGS